MTHPRRIPAKTSSATARRNAIAIATQERAVMGAPFSAISGPLREP